MLTKIPKPENNCTNWNNKVWFRNWEQPAYLFSVTGWKQEKATNEINIFYSQLTNVRLVNSIFLEKDKTIATPLLPRWWSEGRGWGCRTWKKDSGRVPPQPFDHFLAFKKCFIKFEVWFVLTCFRYKTMHWTVISYGTFGSGKGSLRF